MLWSVNKKIYIHVAIMLLAIFFCGCGYNGDKAVVVTETSSEVADACVLEIEDFSDTDVGASTQIIPEELEEVELEADAVTVYVCGAVVSPGVYQFDVTAIKQDALLMAGGFLDGAADSYINLAEPLRDGEKIYFPYEEELEIGYSPLDDSAETYKETDAKVNINTATKEELMTLSGIGESKAQDIISYREEHGGFRSIEEIMNINGIKEGVYNKIKDSIVVD